ncbi:MAG: TatD family hydrolase [Desulfovibrionales bacterium]
MGKKKSRPLPAEMALPAGGADSHAHLDLKDSGDIEENIRLALECGISNIGQVFLGPQAFKTNRHKFARKEKIFFILGIHPHDAGEVQPGDIEQIETFIREEKSIRALGEIGLDYHYMHSSPETQQKLFAQQLELAAQLDIPVVIHCREAEEDALRILDNMGFRDRPLLWHCFGQGTHLAEHILDRGWHLSIPGTVTYRKNTKLQNAVAMSIPMSKMLLETDSPFLAPEPYRGKINSPALIVFTARKIAELKEEKAEKIWEDTGRNCRKFFKINEHS